jgi:HlyD family secretion protein
MKSNKLLLYLIIAAVVLIVFAVIGKKAGWFGGLDPVQVAISKAQTRTIVEYITANGKIQPETEVKISPDVSGEIVELAVEEGDQVDKGQFLLRIKPDTYLSARDRAAAAVNTSKANLANARARLAQVEAQFTRAKKAYQRNERLWEEKTISEAEWEQAVSTYEMAKADVQAARESVKSAQYSVRSAEATLKEAREELVKTSVHAPMSGTISWLNIELGERVLGTSMMQGTEMLRIADLDRMEVKVEVNENDIVRVDLSDTAIIEVDAYLGKAFKGVVTEIAHSANDQGITTDQVTNFDVKIFIFPESYQDLTDPGEANPFRPGMSATVEIRTNTKHNVLSIPIQAVSTRADTSKNVREETLEDGNDDEEMIREDLHEVVFKAENETAKLTTVETGIQDDQFIEIVSGIELGEVVVSAPYSAISRKLEQGSPIEIVDEEDLYKSE